MIPQILVYGNERDPIASVTSYEAAFAVSRLFGDEIIVTRDRTYAGIDVRIMRNGWGLDLLARDGKFYIPK
jgi:hypothetical protein